MNPFLIPTIAGTFGFFFLGIWLSYRVTSRPQQLLLVILGVATAIPAFLFVIFYTGVLGEAGWFYSFRAVPGTELAACGIGLFAGWLQAKRNQSPRVSKLMSAGFIPFLLLICVTIPYLKQVFLRPHWGDFRNRWSEDVCLQSSEFSCGPASAATLLRLFGKPALEKEIAQESFTSRRGTENWYLIRTLRRRGLNAEYSIGTPNNLGLQSPSIIGVRLGGKTGSGHYITILGKETNGFIIGDPLSGREVWTEKKLLDHYYFTGFSIWVTTNSP
ncbi:MAG: hypothetical protein JF609_02000 [Verrucomicrobia bacterium]|nr:hypothetical protein [Verrucomicrobiota bacterium]